MHRRKGLGVRREALGGASGSASSTGGRKSSMAHTTWFFLLCTFYTCIHHTRLHGMPVTAFLIFFFSTGRAMSFG